MDVVTNTVCVSFFVPRAQGKEELQAAAPLHLHAEREADFKASFLKKHCISFHPHIPSPLVVSTSVLSLPPAWREGENRQKEKKRENYAAWIGKVIFSQEQRNNVNGRENGKEEMFR